MREDLLGYLLDALDDADRRRIEAALRRDPQLRGELEALRKQLQGSTHPEEFEPPDGLLEQTCDLVEGCQQQRCSHELAEGKSRDAAWRPRIWSIADSFMGAALFIVAAMLFFPAIANSRFRSDIGRCQRNLQCLGMALCEYSQVNQGAFPRIPVSGHRAAAGIYGPILTDGGFLLDTRVLICPSSSLSEHLADWRVPSQSELDRAGGLRLARMQRSMGGSYGYTLGYMVGDRYYPPRNEGRLYFALLSDAPSLHLLGRRSSNHCGRGQNVLYEDGHIQFIVDQYHTPFRDALFVNRYGFAEAGADRHDSVIGGSNTPPLLLTPAN
jgi:hypothetical protein